MVRWKYERNPGRKVIAMGFGERFKELRLRKGQTQASLDEFFGLSRGTVTAWENGWKDPEEELLEEIAGYFGVKVHELTEDAV